MLIATWNIAGIKARLDTLLNWLIKYNPDIVCLQEIKSSESGFPAAAIEALGYHIILNSQPQFNGVAILSKIIPIATFRGFPGEESAEQARLVEITIQNKDAPIYIVCLYAPNGNPKTSDKYIYKLEWLKKFYDSLKARKAKNETMILAGDFNIIPKATDAKNIAQWHDNALYSLAARRSLSKIKNLGFLDAAELCCPSPCYSFWDFQKGAWPRNNGIRIDFLLLSPRAADKLASVVTHRDVRDWLKPSDHVPVLVQLKN